MTRDAFDAWITRERTASEVATYVVTENGGFAGTAALFSVEGDREVTYWIARHAWGRGVATEALRILVSREAGASPCSPAWPRTTRPRSLSSPRSGSPRSRATSTSLRVWGVRSKRSCWCWCRRSSDLSGMKRRRPPCRGAFVVSCARGEWLTRNLNPGVTHSYRFRPLTLTSR